MLSGERPLPPGEPELRGATDESFPASPMTRCLTPREGHLVRELLEGPIVRGISSLDSPGLSGRRSSGEAASPRPSELSAPADLQLIRHDPPHEVSDVS